ncbi:MAG: lysine--tRNA ligase [Flavobacteriales bacterium AspAUS03]
MQQLSEQEIVRRNKLEQIKSLGIDPYPAATYSVDTTAQEIIENYKKGKEVQIAGRLMRMRIMGKASFAELKDHSGRIQIYITRDNISNDAEKTAYNTVFKKLLDVGDIIGIQGFLFKTHMGEITIHAKAFTLLSKSLRPLPQVKNDEEGQVHDAFSDPEQRYRMRYVDLIVNNQVKEIFLKRSRMIQSIRQFLNDQGYLEVETPILQSIPGGAIARPFITHHNALDIPLYLRIANELYLKRLIVGGFEGVYEFAKDFRNEGMDRIHNPEFTILELYVAYKDYHWMIVLTERLLENTCLAVQGTTELQTEGQIISFKPPYPRVPIFEAIKTHTGFDINEMDEKELRETCQKLGIKTQSSMGKGKLIDEIFGERCEAHYVQPTFIIDHPIEISPLSKKHREKEGLTERFELIINGNEIINAYSELNDPIDQLKRFQEQLRLTKKGDDEAMFIDYDFVRALEFGMPPTAGIGIGIDRLAMLLTGQRSIQEVLFFPQMRPEKKD